MSTSSASSSVPASIPGCSPECSSGISNPGDLPQGRYTTSYFFDGHLTVFFPAGWVSQEDQPVEFNAAPKAEAGTHEVRFWADPFPVVLNKAGTPVRVAGVAMNAAAVVRWLRANPDLQVSASHDAEIGRGRLPATMVDVAISHNAANEDPGCPARVCVVLFSWPNAGQNSFGWGGQTIVRLYLADVAYGGKPHLFVVEADMGRPAELGAFAPAVERLLASVRAPVTPR